MVVAEGGSKGGREAEREGKGGKQSVTKGYLEFLPIFAVHTVGKLPGTQPLG